MKVSLIVAMDSDRGIGKNNDLMWHLPNDMRFFKETTLGQIVVMGRKNYESIPEKYRPLPKRENVVLTRNESYVANDCSIFHSLEECLQSYRSEEDRTVFIIGGGEIYRQALGMKIIDEMYISHVNHSYGADTFFPAFDLKDWTVETILEQKKDDRHAASFSVMRYTKK
ncbi:MAG: dihydrofolate reductase [Crocinitomicaceae bacterium]|nr:dihydrofolate reductase [Flavobacteriales bacterium]NQZ38290.1 dihydrofolate reductase [Crocinitomicaceae bacterium]